MATYNNDLRLKEIGTGDESGTWGTSTNTNLALIADAFGYGTKDIPTDANTTFTMPDATTDGTRAMYLKITSSVSLTVTRTVTLGPNTVSKVWIIENATTGSQSITISQGSGSTVTIANGAKAMVYTDGAGAGASVVSANPTEGTVGTVTSVGGTGTVNGITLTGTVTSSGSLTLGGTLSGVNLASQVTGTLPVANGGTGQTSYTNGQLLIGNTTGNTLTKSTLTAGAGISITNGTGSITIASTSTGGLVYLSAATAASSSLVDLETGFSATYDNYVVIGNDVVLSGADQLIFRLKIGGSYINTATYYNCQTNTSSSTGTSYATITGSSLAGPYNCVVMVFSANSSAVKEASSSMTAATTTPAVYNHIYSHLNTNTGAITGIRFLCVGPTNINSGTFTLYGIAKS